MGVKFPPCGALPQGHGAGESKAAQQSEPQGSSPSFGWRNMGMELRLGMAGTGMWKENIERRQPERGSS